MPLAKEALGAEEVLVTAIVLDEKVVSDPWQVADPALGVMEHAPMDKPSRVALKLATREKVSQVKSIPADGLKVNVSL